MSRFLSAAAVAAVILGCGAGAMAQQPSYSDRSSTSDRYSAPDRSATYPNRDMNYHDRHATQRSLPDRNMPRANMPRDQFASEADARANCRGDTVVWANTKTHVYHFPGAPKFGHTKRGAFMCQADADRSGSFRAAKSEKPVRGFSGSSMPR